MKTPLRRLSVCTLFVLMANAATVPSAHGSGATEPTACYGLTGEQGAPAHAFEFGDVERLWTIIDRLKSGSEPALEQWNLLASGPGYASLIREEIPRDLLLEAIRVAFLPSKQAQQKQWRDQDKPALGLVDHFIELDSKRREVTNLLIQLNHEQAALSQRAVELACSYIAHPARERWPRFTVAFATFRKDARGYSDSIVMDPLFALEAGPDLVHWLAHETHHLLRHPLTVSTMPGAMTGANQSLVWVLHQLQSEGIADQIDKPRTFFGDGYLAHSRIADFFRGEMANAPARIVQLDALIRDLADCQHDCDAIGERIRDTAVMAGHPLGYFMADVIDSALGRAALLDDVGNPARFLATYNRAAIGNARALPAFSDGSLAYASRLFTEP